MGITKSARLDVRIAPRLRQELETTAHFTRRTVTSLVEEALEDIVKKHPAPVVAKT